MQQTSNVYVWVWLPDSQSPVPCGVLAEREHALWFAYAKSYLNNSAAVSLYDAELPLRSGWFPPVGCLAMPGVIRDAHPDGWGQQVIRAKLGVNTDLLPQEYLLNSASDRFGAIDFQTSPDEYVPRGGEATLDDLQQAAELVSKHLVLPASLEAAILHGTSLGGARPKAFLNTADGNSLIAKFSTASDGDFDAVGAEAAAMFLARKVGIDIPNVNVTQSLGRKVLLVKRFDRDKPHVRKMCISGLTILRLDDYSARYGTYRDLLDTLRKSAADPAATGKELFSRIAFNMAISNFDDHLRNHAAFWDGKHLKLTPAFDLAPQQRSGESGYVALAYDAQGNRTANFNILAEAHAIYGLTKREAIEILQKIRVDIADAWNEAADFAQLTTAAKKSLYGQQFLNPATFFEFPNS